MFSISRQMELGYRLQANRKMMEGQQHPDRNAQFEYIKRIERLIELARLGRSMIDALISNARMDATWLAHFRLWRTGRRQGGALMRSGALSGVCSFPAVQRGKDDSRPSLIRSP